MQCPRDVLVRLGVTGDDIEQWHTQHLRTNTSQYVLSGNVTIAAGVRRGELHAVHRLFNTAELLENVLRSLPAIDQLVARRVCKAFDHTIRTSGQIQRHTFLKAFRTPADQQTLRTLAILPYRLKGFKIELSVRHGSVVVALTSQFQDGGRYYKTTLRNSRSLRTILLAQPPPVHAHISASCCCRANAIYTELHDRNGIRLGPVFDAFDRLGRIKCSRCESKFKCFRATGEEPRRVVVDLTKE